MDPNNQNPQVDNPAINKLEQDLKDLSQQTPTASQTPMPAEQPVPPTPEIPETPPVIPNTQTPPVAPVETNILVGQKPKKGSPILIIAIILALVAVLAVVAYVFGAKLLTQSPKQTACTLEAKICPDGSSVGRTGPNCEFAACQTSTPDPTANWKIFIHPTYKFQFKYPSQWSAVISQNAKANTLFGLNATSQSGVGGVEVREISTDPQDFHTLTQSKVSESVPVTINGISGYKMKYSNVVNGTDFVFRNSDGLIYNIYINSENPEDLIIFDQILSTFKFIEATPAASPTPATISTANWKTYTNIDLSFKYPLGWAVGQGEQAIVSDIAGAGITVFTKDMSMYNECMVLGKTDTVDGKMVKYYGYAYSGEACSNKANLGNYEVWITKAGGNGFQPGIIYSYNTTIYPQSFEIFKQILSTFKFTN